MQREFNFTNDAIDEAELIACRRGSVTLGAVVTFLGIVRDLENGQPIAALEYETFEAMARHQFDLVFDTIGTRWPVHSIRLIHRLGRVNVGEVSLWVEVIAPHREEAFAACQFLITEMKRVVPIWKKPVFPNLPRG